MTAPGIRPDSCGQCGAAVALTADPFGNPVILEPGPAVDGDWYAIKVTPRGEARPVWRVRRIVPGEGDDLRADLRRREHACTPRQRRAALDAVPEWAARSKWLIAGTRGDQRYPCRCRGECKPTGWNICPCAGRLDLDGAPRNCCAHRFTPEVVARAEVESAARKAARAAKKRADDLPL